MNRVECGLHIDIEKGAPFAGAPFLISKPALTGDIADVIDGALFYAAKAMKSSPRTNAIARASVII